MKHLFPVRIVETLTKTVYVAADDSIKAAQNVEERWHNGEYVLDSDCFQDVEFFAGETEKFRYYCLMRPVGPGAVPRDFTDWGELDHTVVIPSINHGAWGWVEYERPLTSREIQDYELAFAGDDL